MSLDSARIRAVLFDYGNTLIQFARPQVEACDAALAGCLETMFGPADRERLKALRDVDRLAPFSNGLRERTLPEMAASLVQELYGRQATPDEIARLTRARFEAVVSAIQAPEGVHDLLERLGRRCPLGMVSNYPDGEAIRASLNGLSLRDYFQKVVVSADVGFVKPHPLAFQACLDAMHISPENAVYIGDNWLADVQGAKRIGMQMIRTTQYEAPERFDPQPGDFQPDAVISHISELIPLLA